jgi:hypothetical protein
LFLEGFVVGWNGDYFGMKGRYGYGFFGELELLKMYGEEDWL